MRSLYLNNSRSVVAGKDGYFLVNPQDEYIGRAIALYGEYGALEGDFLSSLIMPADNVVEVGANIGALTVGLAKRVGPTGKVIAFEPQPNCYAFLQAQIALNHLNNIFAINQGVSADAGTLWVPFIDYEQPGNFGQCSLETAPSHNSMPVTVCKLDTVLGDVPINLIKIDVEGMELEVIQGAQAIIEKNKPILYVENDRKNKSEALISQIMAMGYRLWWHYSRLYNPDNYFKRKENIYAEICSLNMVCVHHSVSLSFPHLKEIMNANTPNPAVSEYNCK